jgi:hypothetical protein
VTVAVGAVPSKHPLNTTISVHVPPTAIEVTDEHGLVPPTRLNCALPAAARVTLTGPASDPGPELVTVSVPSMGDAAARFDVPPFVRTSGLGATLIAGGIAVAVLVAVAVWVGTGVRVKVRVGLGVLVCVGMRVGVCVGVWV